VSAGPSAGPVSGLIMAAGASRRMGEPKQLLPFAGGPLLRTVVAAALDSKLAEVIVVLGCRAREIQQAVDLSSEVGRSSGRLKVVVCDEWAQGMSASLNAGLGAADPGAVAVAILLGDQPGVGAELIDHVLEAFAGGTRPLARPVFAAGGSSGNTGAGRAPGHPVVIARSLWPELATLSGDEGARQLIAGRPGKLLEVPMPGEPPADVDTRDDYAQLRKQ
jgi:molybdenum cofactor cytidylyltransferase